MVDKGKEADIKMAAMKTDGSREEQIVKTGLRRILDSAGSMNVSSLFSDKPKFRIVINPAKIARFVRDVLLIIVLWKLCFCL